MKKYICILLLSTLGYSKSNLVNVNVGVQTAYDIFKVNNKEFEKAGLKSVMGDEEYKGHLLTSAFQVETTYKIPTKYVDVKVGLGTDFIVNKNFSNNKVVSDDNSYLKEIKIKELELQENKDKLLELEEKEKDYKYSRDAANNRALVNDSRAKRLARENTSIDQKIVKINEAKTEYPGEEGLKTVKDKQKEYEKVADEKLAKENELNTEFLDVFAKWQAETDTVKKTALRFRVLTLLSEKNRVHEEYVQALAEKMRFFEKEELLTTSVESLEAQKEQNKLDIEQAKKDKTYYDDLKSQYRTKLREVTEEKQKLETLIIPQLEREFDALLYKEPLPALPEPNEDDEYEFADMKDRSNQVSYLAEYENYKTKENVVNSLNGILLLGGSTYFVLEVERNIIDDLKVFANTKFGIKYTENPLYRVGKKLEESKSKVNGSEYIMPESVSKMKVDGFVQFGVGVNYKGLKTELFTGYNKGLIGLRLGYEF